MKIDFNPSQGWRRSIYVLLECLRRGLLFAFFE